MTLLATIAVLAVHALALCGWGGALARLCRVERPPWPLMAAGGLAVVVGLGGVFNLAGIVSPLALWLVVGLGIVLFGRSLRGLPALAPPRPSSLAAGAIIFVVLLIVCAALVPALQFNYHDDFQKYFAHPVRMLATGRVHGSTLSAIGVETLGGQAFLHAFVLNLTAPDALNAVEFGLGLPLCLSLVGFGPAPSAAVRAARLVALLALLVINPQVANVSSSFTGAALSLAVLLLPLPEGAPARRGHAVFIGCLLGAMCALKSSFALLALALWLAHAIAARSLHWALIAALSSAAWLLPWLLAYLPLLRSIGTSPPIPVPAAGGEHVSLFGLEETGFGDGFAPYTLAVALGAGIATFGFVTAPRRNHTARLGLASSLGLVVVYLALVYFVAPRAEGSATSLRLFVPMLLGVLPATLVLVAAVAQPRRSASWIVPFACALVLTLPFGRGVPRRIAQALELGSVLAFEALPQRKWYIDYNRAVLHGDMRARLSTAQARVPAGAPLIAWVNAPFWLDFERNAITDVELAGLSSPWARVPDASYLMWEFHGVATPQLHAYDAFLHEGGARTARQMVAGKRLALAMIDLARRSQLLYDDGQILVLRVEDPAALRERYWKPPALPSAAAHLLHHE